MRSLRARLTLWFSASLMLVLAVFVVFTYRLLHEELHDKNWRRDYPDHPDWNIHGSYSEEEIQDILKELVQTSAYYGLPLALVSLGIGYWLARKSVTPLARVNDQLQAIGARSLSQRVGTPEMDAEFRELVHHVNGLLARLEKSFHDLSEYAAKVAHELRTPLAILRLKVEQAGGDIAPELAEELQAELHQLSHVVDQSLLIAKAEQGRLVLQPRQFDLAQLVAEVAEDFALLAQEEQRVLGLVLARPADVVADPRYIRQIIHSFLANALKHGQGEIRVRLKCSDSFRTLAVVNRRRSPASAPTETLGLGSRVVDTLLSLQPEIRCRRRCIFDRYAVRLIFPAAAGASPREDSRQPALLHDLRV